MHTFSLGSSGFSFTFCGKGHILFLRYLQYRTLLSPMFLFAAEFTVTWRVVGVVRHASQGKPCFNVTLQRSA